MSLRGLSDDVQRYRRFNWKSDRLYGKVSEVKSNITIFLFILLLTALLSAGCHAEASTVEREANPAFKGMELYSWQDETGEWFYSILVGTNRVKAIDEILANPMDFEEVKAEISKMAVGESVFWFNRALESPDGQNLALELPPKEVVEALKQHALACQVTLTTQDE